MHALAGVGGIAAGKQKDRVAEGRYCSYTPTVIITVNDVLRAVAIDANNLTNIRKCQIDAFPLVCRNTPNPRRSGRVPDLWLD